MRRLASMALVRSSEVPSARSMVFAFVESFAIAAPKGRKLVGPLALATADQLTAHNDAALGEAHLLPDLRYLDPPGVAQGRCDELGADVTFAEAFLVHCSSHDISTKLNDPRQSRGASGVSPFQAR